MKKIIVLLTAALFIQLLTGCATIINGTTQVVKILSDPSGAKISIDGRDFGVTPRLVELRRKGKEPGESDSKKGYEVKIELEGFLPYEIKLKRKVEGWFWGNIFLAGFGLVGIIVDAADGAMYKLTPDQVLAQTWKRTALNYNKTGNAIYVAVTLNPDPCWEKVGNLKRIR